MKPIDTIQIEIASMTEEFAEAAFSLACNVFVESSVLHKAMSISIEEYQDYMRLSFETMRKQGLSLIAKDTCSNTLVGCLLACDYHNPEQSSPPLPDKLKPIHALLQSLENSYQEDKSIEAGQYLLVDMAVVAATARELGIYSMLRREAHQIARQAGFSYVLGELSAAATQKLCINRFGHKICAEIEYATFEYLGKTPFSGITHPKSILLVEGEL